jgi:hypothetical protein
MCPADGDVKSEVPCSVSATPVHVKDPFSSSSLFRAVFVNSRHQYEAATVLRQNYFIPVFDVFYFFSSGSSNYFLWILGG